MSSWSLTPPHEPLVPSLKTAAASFDTQRSTPTDGGQDAPRVSSKSRAAEERLDVGRSDPASDKATYTLIRRVLVADVATEPQETDRGIDGLLPPLTSSNEVDIQLYAIIAIVIKDCLNSWYANITPDNTFVEEVVQIIAHCSRSLEQRLRRVDVGKLILDEIPAVLQKHIETYRIAHGVFGQATYRLKPIHIYHTLNAHPALAPYADPNDEQSRQEQQDNESIYRQLLVQSILAMLLPTEDLENTCLRTLVGDITADLIIGQAVVGKASQGWFIHETITKVVGIIKARIAAPKTITGIVPRTNPRSRLETFGLLSSIDDDKAHHSPNSRQSYLSSYFWQLLQYAASAVLLLRFVLIGVSQSRRLPPRSHMQSGFTSPKASIVSPTSISNETHGLAYDTPPPPILSYRCLPAISTLLRLSTRMPWLASSAAFMQHLLLSGPGRFGCANSLLDRFLYELTRTRILPTSLLPQLLLNARVTLFPNNSLGGPALPVPSAEQQSVIRRQAAESVLSLVPPLVAKTIFASSNQQEWISEIEDMLDVFGQAELNKYWIYGILELVLVRLMPELTEKGWSELLAERGVVLDLHEDLSSEKVVQAATLSNQEKPVSTAVAKRSRTEKVPQAPPNGLQKGRKIILTGK